MVFCNMMPTKAMHMITCVTILILIDGFLQFKEVQGKEDNTYVTILILIDGFLQCK